MKIDNDIIFNFICGGLLITISGAISKYYSSYWSGLLYGSFPLAAYYLYFYAIYINGGRKKDGYEFIIGSTVGGLMWVGFILLLYPFHKYVVLKN